jgi:hypothetical protein
MSRYHHTVRQGQCAEGVYVRDCYRRTGRGPSGFEMHYTYQQCSRKAKYGDYCFQHKVCDQKGCDRKPSYKSSRCWEHV